MLYTKELYQHVATRISPNGVFATQAGVADAVPAPHADAGERETVCFGPIRNTLQEVFNCVLPYTQNIPSFGSDWGFVMAFNNLGSDEDPEKVVSEWASPPPGVIHELIGQCIDGGEQSLRMYDAITHIRMFNLTKGAKTTSRKEPVNRLKSKILTLFFAASSVNL
jgi:hypothetical protein